MHFSKPSELYASSLTIYLGKSYPNKIYFKIISTLNFVGVIMKLWLGETL